MLSSWQLSTLNKLSSKTSSCLHHLTFSKRPPHVALQQQVLVTWQVWTNQRNKTIIFHRWVLHSATRLPQYLEYVYLFPQKTYLFSAATFAQENIICKGWLWTWDCGCGLKETIFFTVFLTMINRMTKCLCIIIFCIDMQTGDGNNKEQYLKQEKQCYKFIVTPSLPNIIAPGNAFISQGTVAPHEFLAPANACLLFQCASFMSWYHYKFMN